MAADSVSCWVCGRGGKDPNWSPTHELLKRTMMRVSQAVFDESTPPRDLASLSRRLQDIADRIDTLEERARLEGKSSGRTRTRRGGADRFDETA